jgi:glucoamylase
MAVEIAGLLAAAELAERRGERALAAYLAETADAWEALIDRETWASDTPLAREHGVAGYYVRIAAPDVGEAASPAGGFVPIKNRPPGEDTTPARELVSADALALVRFGLRAPDDPRILFTVRVIDALLAVDLPAGRLWRRYNHDGYGEHEDGRPFDGTGVGRPWPLLAGERGHHELAAGRADAARAVLRTLEAIAGESGLLPEQVWDGDDVPERELYRGRASGSAMPLCWAHAEYLKLRRSVLEGRVFDAPPQTAARYLSGDPPRGRALWRANHRCSAIEPGRELRVELAAPATVRWSVDDWTSVHDSPTRDTGLGVHLCDLPTRELDPGARVRFTFQWREPARWEGRDYAVEVEPAPAS